MLVAKAFLFITFFAFFTFLLQKLQRKNSSYFKWIANIYFYFFNCKNCNAEATTIYLPIKKLQTRDFFLICQNYNVGT